MQYYGKTLVFDRKNAKSKDFVEVMVWENFKNEVRNRIADRVAEPVRYPIWF